MNSILLIPSVEWRDRLFRTGPCGACPPIAWKDEDMDEWWASRPHIVNVVHPPRPALVLAWEGAIVPEGMDRASRCLAEREGLDASDGALWSGDRGGVTTASVHAELSCGRGSEHRYFVALFAVAPTNWTAVPNIAALPEDLPSGLRSAWLLATVCAARGMGEAVTP